MEVIKVALGGGDIRYVPICQVHSLLRSAGVWTLYLVKGTDLDSYVLSQSSGLAVRNQLYPTDPK